MSIHKTLECVIYYSHTISISIYNDFHQIASFVFLNKAKKHYQCIIIDYDLGMHWNENSWLKPKTENEETKAENQNTEINFNASY